MKRVGAFVGVLFVGALAFMGWRLNDERQDKARSVAYVTTYGVKIIKSSSGAYAPRELVEPALETSLTFWCTHRPSVCPQLRNALANASLGFVDTPTVTYAGARSNMRGATVGRAMVVSLAWPLDVVSALITHESGHIFMTVLGYPEGDNGGSQHHATMKQLGFNY